jgi:hypothetical protein
MNYNALHSADIARYRQQHVAVAEQDARDASPADADAARVEYEVSRAGVVAGKQWDEDHPGYRIEAA